MSTSLITANIWSRISETARQTKSPSSVAVAYFGTNGSQLLPLHQGSRLVVDASEKAVKSGQTNPTSILTIMKKGVAVYSVPNLHAKVFVLGKRAFIGSTNASVPSADNRLIEAVLLTTELEAVASARQFVNGLCLHQLTPKLVGELEKIYRPPHFPGGGGNGQRKSKKPTVAVPSLPLLRIAKLHVTTFSEYEQNICDKAIKTARKRRQHRQNYKIDIFRWSGRCAYACRDKVIQVVNEKYNCTFISPPGNVLYVRRYKTHRGAQSAFVYVERPDTHRRKWGVVTKQIGKAAAEALKHSRIVRNQAIAQKLLGIWS